MQFPPAAEFAVGLPCPPLFRRIRLMRTITICVVGSLFASAMFAMPAFVGAAEPAAAVTAPAKPALLKVGFAERDITPELGMEQPGGYGKTYHRTLHDPCKVRASVWDDGKMKAAVVGIDALLIRRETVDIVRAEIEKRCGIPGSSVLIGASHSHSSGPLGMAYPGEFDHASAEVQDLAYNKTSCADPKYLKLVEKQLVDAVVAADAGRVPALVGVGKGIEDKVAFNRRFRMKNGLSMTHPRQGNPDIVEVAGPTDPEVGVIGAWDEKGKLLGCVVNFACHATTNPGGISANYVCYLEQAVQGFFGKDAVVVFAAGCSGDVTQVDNLSTVANPKPEQWAKFVGGRVGAEAVKVLLSVEPGPVGPVAVELKTINVGRRVPRPERVKACWDIVRRGPDKQDATEWTFAKEIVLLDSIIQKQPRVDVGVQAIQIGPAVFVSNPAEYFVEYGLGIKKGSPFEFTFPVELANGIVGYVPTEEALGPHGGGYETRLTYYSNLEPTAGTQIMNAGIELTRRLTPGATPARGPAAPFRAGSGWSYGNLPPELN
jgi:neutral ceramidase